MNRLWISLGIVILSCWTNLPAWGQSIETFILPAEPFSVHWIEQIMQIGPEGDVWLIIPMPQRLMRISGNQIECVFDSGIMNGLHRLTVSPDGTIWIADFQYFYSREDGGLHASGIEIPASGPEFHIIDAPMIDADGRMYLRTNRLLFGKQAGSSIWEVECGQSPAVMFGAYQFDWSFLVSATELWTEVSNFKHDSPQLCEIDLDAGVVKAEYDQHYLCFDAKDSEGLYWFAGGNGVSTFDRQDISQYCSPGDGMRFNWPMVLTADWTVWVTAFGPDWEARGVVRIQGDERRLFTTDDGLLTNSCWQPKIDYDGRMWLFNENDDGVIGLSCISDGGWPPMRLMLHCVETPEGIAVEAQVINNGPVVGVDVYVALELNGQLLYWPNWQPEPHANQINLRPGHNQTATIISAPRATIPPGAYKFWGCMTGRNTQKLIGPIDRKFESLTVEVGDEQD
ncbi:hypothetical protein J7M28_02035 [bacterium]|nr:hypothetical protein [bacterium]